MNFGALTAELPPCRRLPPAGPDALPTGGIVRGMTNRTMGVLVAGVLAAACTKSSDSKAPPPPAPSPTAAEPAAPAAAPAADTANAPYRCEVQVTGDVTTSFVATRAKSAPVEEMSRLGAAADYWLTDDEIRKGLDMLQRSFASSSKPPTDAEIAAKVDQAMKEDPRVMLLLLNCGKGESHLTFSPTKGSKYADVPYGPKKYRLTAADDKPGDFTLMFPSVEIDGQKTGLAPGDGTFEITKFDDTGIAGTFTFPATADGKKVTVAGSFSYACAGGSKCK